MRSDEVTVNPDGSLRLSYTEIQLRTWHLVASLKDDGLKKTAQHLNMLAHQCMWEAEAKLFRPILSSIISMLCYDNNSTYDLARLCAELADGLIFEGRPAVAQKVFNEVCWEAFDNFWKHKVEEVNGLASRNSRASLSKSRPYVPAVIKHDQALILFIGNLYNADLVSSRLIIRLLGEHSRFLCCLTDDFVGNFAKFVKIVRLKLARLSRKDEVILPILGNIKQCAKCPEMSIEKSQFLLEVVELFYV